jgi:M3 family oligoendopeptidase
VDRFVDLRFQQNTSDASRKAALEYRDRLDPKLESLETTMKRELLKSPFREEIAARLGHHAFDLWTADLGTFYPAIEQDLVRESELENEYIELIASAQIDFDGKLVNLSGLEPFARDPDRDVRHRAECAAWSFFAEKRAQLDRIYTELVQLRDAMARKLGCANFIEVGYRRMRRTDYNRADVEGYRRQVERDVVPLAIDVMERRRKRLGIDRMMFWDENIADIRGNPAPLGDARWILERGRDAFGAMDGELGAFFGAMIDRGLLDVETRQGKAAGGFCTSFPLYRVPFIFANFNGTNNDVETLVHEAGHAFQNYATSAVQPFDYEWPTSDACEIHSMSLEYLTYPEIERFFGDDGKRFRSEHLEDAITFLPYGVAVDHFQHLVYERPQATPDERNQMWLEVERRYLPWRDYGDLEYPARGGRWQEQSHIYGVPFYYIDYTLALCCALQFWVRSQGDHQAAMADYVSLCRRGGSAPFRRLTAAAGLQSPFEDGALRSVMESARRALL